MSLVPIILAMAPPASGQKVIRVADRTLSYRDIVEDANSIILVWDSQTRITYVNDFCKKYFGYAEGELIGKSFLGTILPETGPSGQKMATMGKDILAHPEQYVSASTMNRKKNGELAKIHWSNKVLYDDKGNAAGCIAVGIPV